MQGLLVLGAWIFAVVFAAVILGFCVYELRWKIRRLQGDRVKLEGVIAALNVTVADLQGAAERSRNRSAG